MNYYQLVYQIKQYNEEQKRNNLFYAIYGEEGMAKKPELKANIDKLIGLVDIPAPPMSGNSYRRNRRRSKRNNYSYTRVKIDKHNNPIKVNIDIEVEVKKKQYGQH